jgi:hypothetical protein
MTPESEKHHFDEEPSTEPARPRTSSDLRVTYDLGVDTHLASRRRGARHRSPSARSEPETHAEPISPSLLRRRTSRANTFKTIIDDCDDLESYGALPGWQPGSEPGYDPQLPDGGHTSMPTLSAECEITVVDFSSERVVKRLFNNDTFIAFIGKPKPSWAKCRWINVNGLSWDVIQAVGTEKGLHKLALEDIMNLRNRTKADW